MRASGAARGAFVTIEGGEGGGKSTQVKALVKRLHALGIDAIATREPGGTETAEFIRTALLEGVFEDLGPRVEALLFAAARIDHLDSRIKPALLSGSWVVSDRFQDSTRAYQGVVGAVESRFLRSLERVTLAGTRPDLTVIIDVPAEVGLARAARRRAPGARPDRFERQSPRFHENLRDAFLMIAKREPERCVVVDGTKSQKIVGQAVWEAVKQRLKLPSQAEKAP